MLGQVVVAVGDALPSSPEKQALDSRRVLPRLYLFLAELLDFGTITVRVEAHRSFLAASPFCENVPTRLKYPKAGSTSVLAEPGHGRYREN
jgi:hypothetical protein